MRISPEKKVAMRAVICDAIGSIDGLRIDDVESPEARPGQVLIRVGACGINFYDGLAVAGKYQTKPDLPFSPGGEIAGTVIAVGEGVFGLFAGQRVLAFTGFGGYAEEVAVPAAQVFALPNTMTFKEAAGFLIAYATSYHALKDRAALRPGRSLLVLGAAGGVGLTAVEIGKLMGARVITAASQDKKLALCQRYGADETVNYSRTDLKSVVMDLTEGRGVDIVFDPVGGEVSKTALRCLAVGGQHLVIGFASGDIPKLGLNQLLLKQISVTGVLWGAFSRAEPERNAENISELLAWHCAGSLKPHISETYPFNAFATALSRVMNREARGKIVLQMDAVDRIVPAGWEAAK